MKKPKVSKEDKSVLKSMLQQLKALLKMTKKKQNEKISKQVRR
jgi:hypothetical protein